MFIYDAKQVVKHLLLCIAVKISRKKIETVLSYNFLNRFTGGGAKQMLVGRLLKYAFIIIGCPVSFIPL